MISAPNFDQGCLNPACDLLGVPRVSSLVLRHAAVKAMHDAGITPLAIEARLELSPGRIGDHPPYDWLFREQPDSDLYDQAWAKLGPKRGES